MYSRQFKKCHETLELDICHLYLTAVKLSGILQFAIERLVQS